MSNMSKMKSRSAVKKRFKITKNGKVKRGKAYTSHILNKKSRKRKRNLRHATLVHTSQESKIRSMLLR